VSSRLSFIRMRFLHCVLKIYLALFSNSYDKEAIEEWFQSHTTSPKTGQPLEHLALLPNLNLKRLIRDMVKEGGVGLYYDPRYIKNAGKVKKGNTSALSNNPDGRCDDGTSNDVKDVSQMALIKQKVLTCRCLGPLESTWNGRSFRVTESGSVGGRRRPEGMVNEPDQREFVQFSDPTVSRRHFEIEHDAVRKQFRIRDVGSAGGTFLRVPPGTPQPLKAGMMVMLGKHQLVVLDKGEGNYVKTTEENFAPPGRNGVDVDGPVGTDGTLADRPTPKYGDVSLQPCSVEEISVNHDGIDVGDGDVLNLPTHLVSPEGGSEDAGRGSSNFGHDAGREGEDHIVLKCFAPEGTPIQGREFPVGLKGATLGRKQGNTISFSHKVDGQYVGIDSSISGEHASMRYRKKDEGNGGGCFELFDGCHGKLSTNGTWLRLSPMHECSEYFPLKDKSEFLVGTVRFQVTVREVLVERSLNKKAKK